MWPVIALKEGNADLQAINLDHLSSGQRILVKAARELYNQGDSFSIAKAADTLDEKYWGILLNAISIYGGTKTGE